MKNFILIAIIFLIGYVPAYYATARSIRSYLGARLVVPFLLATLAGFVLPNTISFFICLAILVLASVRTRQGAICQYILLAGLIGQVNYALDIRGHYIGFVDQLAVVGLAAYAAARIRSVRQRGAAPFSAEDGLIIATFLIMAVGGYGFPDLTTIIRAWTGQALVILLPYFLLRYAVRSSEDFRKLVACFGFSAFILSVFAIYEVRHGWSIFEAMNFHLGSAVLSKNMLTRGGSLRASATMSGPLALGCYLTIGIIALACSRDFFKSKPAYWAIIGVTLLGLLGAQSRGSLVALAAALVMLCIAWRRWGLAAFLTGGAAVGAATLIAAAHLSPTIAAFLNINQPAAFAGYFDYRQLLFDKGIEEVVRHPLTGMRLEPVVDALSSIRQGENIVDLVNVYLVMLLISGLLGFVPFVVLTIKSLHNVMAGFRKVIDRELLSLRAFCMAGFTATLIQLSFMSFIDRIPMLFAVTLVGIRFVSQQRKAAISSAAKPGSPGPAVTQAAMA